MTTRTLIPLALLIAVQILDVIVHVATGQVEVIRITSNAIIAVGAIASVFFAVDARKFIYFAAFLYLVLNIAFLVRHGLVNPATDALRLPLFGFVVVSLLLMAWLARRLTTARPTA